MSRSDGTRRSVTSDSAALAEPDPAGVVARVAGAAAAEASVREADGVDGPGERGPMVLLTTPQACTWSGWPAD